MSQLYPNSPATMNRQTFPPCHRHLLRATHSEFRMLLFQLFLHPTRRAIRGVVRVRFERAAVCPTSCYFLVELHVLHSWDPDRPDWNGEQMEYPLNLCQCSLRSDRQSQRRSCRPTTCCALLDANLATFTAQLRCRDSNVRGMYRIQGLKNEKQE